VKSPWGIYTVAALSTVYSLLTLVDATRTAGQRWPGVFAALLLIGAIGLFLKQRWARVPIYYATTLASVLGLVPGGAGAGVTTLLFDLDGTLTDPRPGIVRCMKYALDRLHAPCPSDDVLASFIGPPLRGTFATLLETSDRALVERALARYREQYADTGLFENHVYDGVARMLHDIPLMASAAFVATLKPKVYADRIVHRLGLARHFAGVYGPELEGRFDDKAELLAELLAVEKISSENVVTIGDRAGDIVAVLANGTRSIGVLWGYGSRAELVDAGADGLARGPGAGR
jgi:phosphoglycolate phosphatase